MIAMLNDPHAMVRARVAHALGDLQATAAIPMLRQQLDDPDPEALGMCLLTHYSIPLAIPLAASGYFSSTTTVT